MAIIHYLTKIIFDDGAVASLAEEVARLELKKILLVTDPGVAKCGLAQAAVDQLPKPIDVERYEKTPANPTESAVAEAADQFRNTGRDGIVAVGGGSPLDLAKATAVLATHAGTILDFSVAAPNPKPISAQTAPVFSIPTTAGTGSEVGRAALIVAKDGRKLAMISPHMLAKCAICDPELTRGLPPALTAATGMDAIAHCIETYLSPEINPPADAIALDGLSRAVRFIERATADGNDREARWQMMMAALQGGLGFQKGLGAVHALSHALGGLADPVLHHGTLNAVFLPAVLRFNTDHCGDKYQGLRAALGIDAKQHPADYIAELNQRLGIPANLEAMGVPASQLPPMVSLALADPCTETNPRPPIAEDYVGLLDEAFAGSAIY
jgi:4-hydroxybutyrate dehydrogenase